MGLHRVRYQSTVTRPPSRAAASPCRRNRGPLSQLNRHSDHGPAARPRARGSAARPRLRPRPSTGLRLGGPGPPAHCSHAVTVGTTSSPGPKSVRQVVTIFRNSGIVGHNGSAKESTQAAHPRRRAPQRAAPGPPTRRRSPAPAAWARPTGRP